MALPTGSGQPFNRAADGADGAEAVSEKNENGHK